MTDHELLAEAIRGFLLEKHLPFSELDSWADELVAIVAEHAGVVPAEPANHDTPAVEPAQAAEAFQIMFERPATTTDGLDAAADFLDGLLRYANFHSYLDPVAGEVSTYFVLLMVRAAQHAAVAAVDGEAPA